MGFKKIFFRGRNLLLATDNEFEVIRREMPSVSDVNKSFIIPVAVLISLFSLVESLLTHISSPINAFIFIAFNTVILFLLIFSHCYVSGKLITLIGKNMKENDVHSNYYALSAYSQLPFFIVLATIKLFPSLIFLIVLSLYSGVLLNKGSGKLTRVPIEKQLQFTLLSLLVIITVFIITSELFTLLYSEILAQFSTFAAE